MEKNYSEQQFRKALEAAIKLVSAEKDLAHWISGDKIFARENLARAILREISPEYKENVPKEFQNLVNVGGIEKRCIEAIKRIRGRSYRYRVIDY